jgi:hypothetical protein
MFNASSIHRLSLLLLTVCISIMENRGQAAELLVGGATVSITPDQPVALWGQMHTRISTGVESPVTATVLVLESVDGDKSLEQAIMVSCDLVAIPQHVLEKTRAQVAMRLPDFSIYKIVLSATHTHTGPVLKEGLKESCSRRSMSISLLSEWPKPS